jgi:hypothetical protein
MLRRLLLDVCRLLAIALVTLWSVGLALETVGDVAALEAFPRIRAAAEFLLVP